MQLVWLRNDLRIEDNPALHGACEVGQVVCVYVVTPQQWQQHDDAPAKIAFWRSRLKALSLELSQLNIPLKVISAPTYQSIPQALLALANSLKAQSLWFNHEYPLNEAKRDQSVIEQCQQAGLNVHTFHGDVVVPPGAIKTQTGTVYHVFTPFSRQWRRVVSAQNHLPLSSPLAQKKIGVEADNVEDVWLLDKTTFRDDLWPVDSEEIHQRLHRFSQQVASHYKECRDYPNVLGTSVLSPYLACGAISVKQCMLSVNRTNPEAFQSQWVTELIWREFYRHLIFHYPHLSKSEDFKRGHDPIPWDNSEANWRAWCEGKTGFPIVDAGMRQLVQTGWMHNRVRMIVAAFLTKLLLIDWRRGEAFFMQHLMDGDYASNNGGWQWAASTGADSVPYFRIFNPKLQSERFDPQGKYIKRFLPELTDLDDKSIHEPNLEHRQACGYPVPIIDYKFARQRALDIYAKAMSKKEIDAVT